MTDVYTIDEVARHNNAEDLWVVIDGVIYNLTLFYKEHPGGEEVLLELAGQDATECFNNVGHSHEALNLRECFKIGVLVDGSGNPDSSDRSSSKSKMTEESTEKEEPVKDDWKNTKPKNKSPKQSTLVTYIAYVLYGLAIVYWYNNRNN